MWNRCLFNGLKLIKKDVIKMKGPRIAPPRTVRGAHGVRKGGCMVYVLVGLGGLITLVSSIITMIWK